MSINTLKSSLEPIDLHVPISQKYDQALDELEHDVLLSPDQMDLSLSIQRYAKLVELRQ